MPYCPNCRAEFRAGFDTCADCKVPLVRELDLPATSAPPEALAVVVRTDPVSGEMIADSLAQSAIDCFLEPIFSPGIIAMGYVRVLVAKSQRQAALVVVEDLRRRFPSMKLDYTGLSETPPFFGA